MGLSHSIGIYADKHEDCSILTWATPELGGERRVVRPIGLWPCVRIPPKQCVRATYVNAPAEWRNACTIHWVLIDGDNLGVLEDVKHL